MLYRKRCEKEMFDEKSGNRRYNIYPKQFEICVVLCVFFNVLKIVKIPESAKPNLRKIK